MRRLIVPLMAAVMLTAALPALANSYYGYVRHWWVEENGDIVFYLFSNSDAANTVVPTHYVTGLCGWANYRLKVTSANYDEVFASLKLAAKNNYRTIMEVVTCDASINVIKMVKVCTMSADC